MRIETKGKILGVIIIVAMVFAMLILPSKAATILIVSLVAWLLVGLGVLIVIIKED